LTLALPQPMMKRGNSPAGLIMHPTFSNPFRAARLVFLAAAVFGVGCEPRSPAIASPDATNLASVPTAAQSQEIAGWRTEVARIRGDIAELANGSTNSSEQLRTRLKQLTTELAKLEQRIAAVENAGNAPAPEQPANSEVRRDDAKRDDAKRDDAKRDDAVKPANLEAPLEKPRDDHPFAPAVKRAKAALVDMKKVKDYESVIVKRVRVDGKLFDTEFMHAKIRHEPFSVYLRFLAPEDKRDREVIYVEGQNDGNLLAHESPNRKGLVGILSQTGIVGTTSLPPKHPLAMVGNNYPITKIGILNLTQELIEIGEKDMRHDPATAKSTYYPNAKVEDRDCEAFVFLHPEQSKSFTFHRAEVFIDKKLNVPIRYVSYGWPEKPGDTPPLIESYTYTRLKLNVGLKDEDFDTKNPKYKYPQ
jgi:hypothetical protein